MRKLLFALLLVAAAIIPAHAQDSLGTCIQSKFIATTASGNTVVVAGVANQSIHLCSVHFKIVDASTAASYALGYSPSSTCASGVVAFTGTFPGLASTSDMWIENRGISGPWTLPAGDSLCLMLGAAPTAATIDVTYTPAQY